MDDHDELMEVVRLIKCAGFDMRGHFTGMRGYLDLLLQGHGGDLSPVQREVLEKQVRRVQFAAWYFYCFEAYMTNRYHRGDELWHPVVLTDMVNEELPISFLGEKGILVTVDLPLDLCAVKSFYGIGKLFSDLLGHFSNSYRSKASVKSIAVSARQEGEWVAVTVRIEGTMDPYEVERPEIIFSPGTPASVSQMIVRRHGSDLKISEISGDGVVFEFALPV